MEAPGERAGSHRTEGDEDVLVPKPEEAPQPLEVIPSPPSDEEVPCTS